MYSEENECFKYSQNFRKENKRNNIYFSEDLTIRKIGRLTKLEGKLVNHQCFFTFYIVSSRRPYIS